jgi:hypothetical protein
MPKRPLAPRFITKLDDYLLKNRPDTWSTRAHLVLYYTIMYALGLAALCFVIPDNPLRDSFTGYWVMAQSVLVIVAIILWIVYLVRFNTFKSYGITYGGDRLKTYFSFFLAIICMIGTVFIPPVVETYKAMIHYSPSQIVEDMDEMNVLLARLSKDEYPAEVTVDTIYVVNQTSTYNYNPNNSSYTWNDSLGAYVKGPIYMTREELKWTLSDQDSVVWINNDKLIRFQVTSLSFLSHYKADEDGDVKPLTSFEIYNRVYKSGSATDKQTLERQFYEVSQKYRDPHNEDDYYWNYNTDAYSVISSKYNVGQVNSGISNILQRYYRWDEEEIIISYHVIYYIGMFLGLCLFIFRHSTIRTFFLSVLTGIVLAILTGIMGAFFEWDEDGAIAAAYVYFAFFFIFSLTTVNWKIRSVFTGIALNLAVVCTPFLPFLGVAWYYANDNYYSDYYYTYGYGYDDSYQQYRDTMNMHYWLSELFGFLILLVLIETVYKWMYRRWFAAPEE